MSSLLNLRAGFESFGGRFEDEGSSVSIEQKIEVESEVAEEMEEQQEVVEEATENEETAEAAEEMIATFEYAELAMNVIKECGWSRPVAMAFNYKLPNGRNHVEEALGICLPSNESLDMVASPYDSNSVMALESFKESMKEFWNWIKKMANKIWEGIKSLASRLMALLSSIERTTKRLAAALKDVTAVDADKVKDKTFTILSKDNFNKAVAELSALFALTDASTVTKDYPAIGLTVKDSNIEMKDDALKADKDVKCDEHGGMAGWTLGDAKNNAGIVTLLSAGRKAESNFKTKMADAKKAESNAARLMNSYSDSDGAESTQAKADKDAAKKTIKELALAQKILAKATKVAATLAKHFIRVQRAYIAVKKNS